MSWEFIATEFVGADGEEGEHYIWEAITKALRGTGEGVAFLNYTDFRHTEQKRFQPDILLLSRDWGLAVIEVKTCSIDQIVRIQANQWEMQRFYSRYINPFKQGENQLWHILKRCDRRNQLKDRIPGRVIVALPLISREEWRHRGFEAEHPTCPPIIFGDELTRRSLLNSLENSAIILNQGESPLELTDQQWALLEREILGHPKVSEPSQAPAPAPLARPKFKGTARPQSSVSDTSTSTANINPPASSTPSIDLATNESEPRRIEVLTEFRQWISDIDIQQAKIGMQIPPGPQRIRGIAGSGKTLLLCQKAARMHIQHPDWDIALVFFTRSLYELLPDLVRQWLHYWSDGELSPDLQQGNLKVIHAWGSKERPGFYSLLRDRAELNAIVSEKPTGTLPERLAASCKRLLDNGKVQPIFDAILIDEGQDLAVNDEWKYDDKQAIYWLAWQALRPVNEKEPNLKRLIWAYDEAQSLDSLGVPSYGEVFGEELGGSLSGARTGPTYKGGIKKSEVMKRCYRTPGSTLIAAHAIGMGLLRQEGMLSGFTTKADWDKIGYAVTQGTFTSGNWITLHRPPEHSPNPIPEFWGKHPLEFEIYDDRQSQLQAIVDKIKHNLDYDGLQPSRDILIIILGADQDDQEQEQRRSQPSYPSSQLQRQVANNLQANGIPYYMPGAKLPNRYPDSSSRNADRFWHEGAITVSRMYRAKGHEAPMVYILGMELVAQDETNLALRNQLFVALTRSMAWVHLSGIKDPDTHGDYLLYEEMRKVIGSGDTLNFIYRKPPRRTLSDNED